MFWAYKNLPAVVIQLYPNSNESWELSATDPQFFEKLKIFLTEHSKRCPYETSRS